MRKMKIKNWKTSVADEEGNPVLVADKDGKPTKDKGGKYIVKEVNQNILDVLTKLLNDKPPQEMPRGLDNFRLMSGISKAFDKARGKKALLELEDKYYIFLKNMVETDIPCGWGGDPNVFVAIDEFMELKTES